MDSLDPQENKLPLGCDRGAENVIGLAVDIATPMEHIIVRLVTDPTPHGYLTDGVLAVLEFWGPCFQLVHLGQPLARSIRAAFCAGVISRNNGQFLN